MVVVCVARCVLYGVCCAHPLRRVLRKCATANRTSLFAPQYAENRSGDVTGELPQARMLITATCVCGCVCVCVCVCVRVRRPKTRDLLLWAGRGERARVA